MQEQKFKLTSAVKNNSARGTALLEKAKSLAHKDKLDSIKGLTDILKSESLSLDQVKELYAFLNKAQSKYNPNRRLQGNNLDADSAAFLAAGGSSGLAWSKLVLKEAGVLKSLTKDIQEAETEVEEDLNGITLPVAKSVNDEKRLATFLVLEPQDDDYTTNDAHADWYDADMVEKSCYNFNRHCMRANLFHMMPTTAFEFIESYVTKSDSVLGGRFIKKGSWLATIYVDTSPMGEEIWQGIKSGEFNGLSIQAMGSVESI